MRPSGRNPNQLRPVTLTRNYTMHAEGSVLVEFGVDTGAAKYGRGKLKNWGCPHPQPEKEHLTIVIDSHARTPPEC